MLIERMRKRLAADRASFIGTVPRSPIRAAVMFCPRILWTVREPCRNVAFTFGHRLHAAEAAK
jgi:hypothetical protein